MKNHLYLFSITLLTSTIHSAGNPFENPLENHEITYEEKDISLLIERAKKTQAERVAHAFSVATGEGLREAFVPIFANLWQGKDLDETNQILQEVLTTTDPAVQQKYRLNDAWCLAINQQFYHMYYAFGSKGNIAPGRLYPETEKVLLEVLWERMKYKDDIHIARESTWWMIGSENHDLVAKVSSLISSQIFMNEPEYRDRIYPDLGTGGGNKYWFHRMYAKDIVDGPQGRANLKDGKAYTAKDHYEAWVSYFMEYFSERAERGFFLEVASSNYMAVTVSYLNDIYDLCEDPALSKKAGKFLDLVWADWAQDQLNGVRGGAKTRADGSQWNGAMYKFARFYFGGEGSAATHYFAQLLSQYELDPLIWELALDREGLGEFAFVSRKPGEEENVWPRPLGTERSMLCDTESRFVRYSWVTPDYIIGTQMDHPAAVHSHLSNQARWQGITFKGNNGPRVYPTDIVNMGEGKYERKRAKAYARTVQSESVMIVQQSRGWSQVNPDWFPAKDITGLDYGIYIGDQLDRVEEKQGWIFIEVGDAFLAIKPVMGEYSEGWTILVDDASPGLTSEIMEDSYGWSADKKFIFLKDKYAGIIFEASRRIHHKSLEVFMDDVLDNLIVLEKTVVPGYHILKYRGCGDDAETITFNLANNEIPFIGESRVDYAPDMLFESPYIKSKYKSGIIEVSKGDKQLILDFND